MKVQELPEWILSLFDGDDSGDNADNQDTGDNTADSGQPDKRNDVRNDQRRGQRDRGNDRARENNGRFETEAEERIYNALERQRDQTKAAERQAKQAKAQIDELAPKAAMADVMAQRALRLDARDALRDAGVLHPDVVDLFLAKSPDVKLDVKTGETVGIPDALAKFQASHASLFKVEAKADDTDKGDKADKGDKGHDSGSDDKGDGKKNATSKGASPAGNDGSANNSGGIPDLRGLTPQQRKAAMTAYKNSLNVH